MTKEQLARWRAMGFEFDEFHDTIAKDAVELDKKIEIDFISANFSNGKYHIQLKVSAQNLKVNSAVFTLKEVEVLSDEAVVTKVKQINTNSSSMIEFIISASELAKLSKSMFEGKFEFKISIEADGLKAETAEFTLPEPKTNKPTSSSKDVFTLDETKELKDEILWVTRFVELESPREYAGNYCMQAAERGLSKLLLDKQNFYSVDRNHKHLNKINFSGLTAEDRGKRFKSLGYVSIVIDFNSYELNKNILHKIIDSDSLGENMYDVLTYKQKDLKTKIDASIKGKNGFHIFYFSVSDNFHTLILIVNNLDEDNISYEVYDQHGLTSSFGEYSNIEEGLLRQSSWTFANQYFNMGHTIGLYPKSNTRLWKIQKK